MVTDFALGILVIQVRTTFPFSLLSQLAQFPALQLNERRNPVLIAPKLRGCPASSSVSVQ
jgi:hypothetical protein